MDMNAKHIKIIILIVGFFLILTTATGFVLFASANSSANKFKDWWFEAMNNDYKIKLVEAVKGMKWNGSSKTIGEGANGFMSDPKFEGGFSDGNKFFVSLKGGISYQDKPVQALVQFVFEPEMGYVEIDGESKTRLMGNVLVKKMCE
jgi:hypothetical protein